MRNKLVNFLKKRRNYKTFKMVNLSAKNDNSPIKFKAVDLKQLLKLTTLQNSTATTNEEFEVTTRCPSFSIKTNWSFWWFASFATDTLQLSPFTLPRLLIKLNDHKILTALNFRHLKGTHKMHIWARTK